MIVSLGRVKREEEEGIIELNRKPFLSVHSVKESATQLSQPEKSSSNAIQFGAD
jgi:hypothetical protein